MANSKVTVEVREPHSFTLVQRQKDDGNWLGQVWRFPHPINEKELEGENIGPVCEAPSEEELKTQLDKVIADHS